jgi:hypothetical protein
MPLSRAGGWQGERAPMAVALTVGMRRRGRQACQHDKFVMISYRWASALAEAFP